VIKRLLANEPVAISDLIEKGLLLGVAFGLGLDGKQVAAVAVFAGALLTLIARQAVTPTVRVEDTVRDAATEVVSRLDDSVIGATGAVTGTAKQIIETVVKEAT
jgi:hypothetical protein